MAEPCRAFLGDATAGRAVTRRAAPGELSRRNRKDLAGKGLGGYFRGGGIESTHAALFQNADASPLGGSEYTPALAGSRQTGMICPT